MIDMEALGTVIFQAALVIFAVFAALFLWLTLRRGEQPADMVEKVRDEMEREAIQERAMKIVNREDE